MNQVGYYSLGSKTVTTADTQEGDWLDGFDDNAAITFQVDFRYGSGGGDVEVFLQTSIDQGVTPIDIAAFVFEDASGVYVITLTKAFIAGFSPTDGALTPGTSINGVLGDRFRFKLVSTGTYAGSTGVTVGLVAA